MNKLIGVLMTIVVGVIMVGSVLVPSLTDTEDSMYDTFTNTASYEGTGIPVDERFIMDGEDNLSFETHYVSATDFTASFNDDTVDFRSIKGAFITTDKCRLVKNGWIFQLFDESGTRVSNVSMQSVKVSADYVASTGAFTVNVYTDLTDDTVANTYTYDTSKIVYYSPNGDYLATYLDGTNTFYVNTLDQVVSGGAYTSGELDTSYFAEGETITVGNSSYTGTATLDDVAVDGYLNLYSGTTQTITITDGTSTETFTPYTAYVPETVTAISEQNNTYISLMGVIPVLMIVGLFATAVVVMFRARD